MSRLLISLLALLLWAPTVQAAGIAGPNQATAEKLPVLLGDPAKSGTAWQDTDPGTTFHWRQLITGNEPWVKLSHIDNTTTMFIAPEVTVPTVFTFGLTRNTDAEATTTVTVHPLGLDTPANTTYIDHLLASACTTYDPAARACGSGAYRAMPTSFLATWSPAPAAGWRYVFREGTYSYAKNGGACRSTYTPVLQILNATGTAMNPIQYKTYFNGTSYEPVVLDMGPASDCGTATLVHVSNSHYIIVEGFEVVGNRAGSTPGPVVAVGGIGGGGGINYNTGISDHVTIRHVLARDNGALGVSDGLFIVRGPHHDIAFHYIQALRGGAGVVFGKSQNLDRTLQPWNIFVHTFFTSGPTQHVLGSGFSTGGGRNIGCYRCVSRWASDGGFLGQGPDADSIAFWDSVVFGVDSSLSPNFSPTLYGNERGVQFGTINPGYAKMPFCGPGGTPGLGCFRGAMNTRFYRLVSVDNMGNGWNDAGGITDTRAYHMTIFNNCRRTRGVGLGSTSFAAIDLESHAGDPDWPGTPPPATTLVNTASYWNGGSDGCEQGGPHNIGPVGFPPNLVPWSILTYLGVGPGTVNANWTLVAGPTVDARFVAPNPPDTGGGSTATDAPASTVTVDTTMYLNRPARALNPAFGVVTGLTLQSTSPLIDAGTFIAGVHCARADDDPNPFPGDPNCIHWRGSKPDIGAYEFDGGLPPPPPPPPSQEPRIKGWRIR